MNYIAIRKKAKNLRPVGVNRFGAYYFLMSTHVSLFAENNKRFADNPRYIQLHLPQP